MWCTVIQIVRSGCRALVLHSRDGCQIFKILQRACVRSEREEHLSKCLSDVLDVVGGLGFSLCSNFMQHGSFTRSLLLCDSASSSKHTECVRVIRDIKLYAPLRERQIGRMANHLNHLSWRVHGYLWQRCCQCIKILSIGEIPQGSVSVYQYISLDQI